MRLALLLSVAMFASTAASADSRSVSAFPEYEMLLRECIDSKKWASEKVECEGVLYRACGEARQETISWNRCLGAEFDVWNDYLARIHEAMRAEFLEIDREEADKPPAVSLVKALDEAQAAWLRHRTAECALAYAEFQWGSGRATYKIGCELSMTVRRTYTVLAGYRSASANSDRTWPIDAE